MCTSHLGWPWLVRWNDRVRSSRTRPISAYNRVVTPSTLCVWGGIQTRSWNLGEKLYFFFAYPQRSRLLEFCIFFLHMPSLMPPVLSYFHLKLPLTLPPSLPPFVPPSTPSHPTFYPTSLLPSLPPSQSLTVQGPYKAAPLLSIRFAEGGQSSTGSILSWMKNILNSYNKNKSKS